MPLRAPGASGGALFGALALSVAVVVAGCSPGEQEAASIEPAAASTVPGAGDAGDGGAEQAGDQAEDRTLDAPPVEPGACEEVVVTPPGAPTPAEARLCLPPAGATERDAGVVLVHGGGGTSGSPEAL